jgi:hypothetical protein
MMKKIRLRYGGISPTMMISQKSAELFQKQYLREVPRYG